MGCRLRNKYVIGGVLFFGALLVFVSGGLKDRVGNFVSHHESKQSKISEAVNDSKTDDEQKVENECAGWYVSPEYLPEEQRGIFLANNLEEESVFLEDVDDYSLSDFTKSYKWCNAYDAANSIGSPAQAAKYLFASTEGSPYPDVLIRLYPIGATVWSLDTDIDNGLIWRFISHIKLVQSIIEDGLHILHNPFSEYIPEIFREYYKNHRILVNGDRLDQFPGINAVGGRPNEVTLKSIGSGALSGFRYITWHGQSHDGALHPYSNEYYFQGITTDKKYFVLLTVIGDSRQDILTLAKQNEFIEDVHESDVWKEKEFAAQIDCENEWGCPPDVGEEDEYFEAVQRFYTEANSDDFNPPLTYFDNIVQSIRVAE